MRFALLIGNGHKSRKIFFICISYFILLSVLTVIITSFENTQNRVFYQKKQILLCLLLNIPKTVSFYLFLQKKCFCNKISLLMNKLSPTDALPSCYALIASHLLYQYCNICQSKHPHYLIQYLFNIITL